MEKKDYFIFKVRTSLGAEYWDTQLWTSENVSGCVSNLLSLDLTIIGIKHLILD